MPDPSPPIMVADDSISQQNQARWIQTGLRFKTIRSAQVAGAEFAQAVFHAGSVCRAEDKSFQSFLHGQALFRIPTVLRGRAIGALARPTRHAAQERTGRFYRRI